MAFEFTRDELFNKFYPHVRLPIPVFSTKRKVEIDENDTEANVWKEPESEFISSIGTPIFFPVKVDGYDFPNGTLISVKGSKTIVETEITDYAGNFKEDMGLNDYQITIQGLIINEDENTYPEEIVRKIRAACEKRGSLEVVSPLFTTFNIDLITIKSWSFPSRQGFQSVQPYEIQAVSDRSIELVLKEKDLGF